MTMLPPTPRQRQAERFIEKYAREHDGCAPSFVEIAEALNITVQGAHYVIKGLVARGRAIRGGPWQARSIRLLCTGREGNAA